MKQMKKRLKKFVTGTDLSLRYNPFQSKIQSKQRHIILKNGKTTLSERKVQCVEDAEFLNCVLFFLCD